jgi:hypothetical protein
VGQNPRPNQKSSEISDQKLKYSTVMLQKTSILRNTLIRVPADGISGLRLDFVADKVGNMELVGIVLPSCCAVISLPSNGNSSG